MRPLLVLFTLVALTAPAHAATLVITSDQAEVDAYLDGVRVGLTPAKVENVAPGEHTLRVEGAGLVGERRFAMGEADRTVHVPFSGLGRPLAVGLQGALGFRGGSALVSAGGGFTYHLVNHEIGVAADWFNVRGEEDLRMQGVIARLEYGFVPFWTSGGPNVAIRPLKLLARINVVQTTRLAEDVPGGDRDLEDVAGLGAGLGAASEVQWRGLGIEPRLYYDVFGLRSVGTAPNEIKPKLDNGGLQLRVKYYFP